MTRLSLFKKASIACALILLPATWLATRSWAFNPQPDPPGFSGLVGIVEGQTARLNALNTSSATINVVLNFVDMNGTIIKQSRVMEVQPGHAVSLGLTAVRTDDGGGTARLEVYGEVVLLPAVRGVIPPDPYVPTLEVYDASGRTSVFVPNFHNLPSDHNPPGDRPAGN